MFLRKTKTKQKYSIGGHGGKIEKKKKRGKKAARKLLREIRVVGRRGTQHLGPPAARFLNGKLHRSALHCLGKERERFMRTPVCSINCIIPESMQDGAPWKCAMNTALGKSDTGSHSLAYNGWLNTEDSSGVAYSSQVWRHQDA